MVLFRRLSVLFCHRPRQSWGLPLLAVAVAVICLSSAGWAEETKSIPFDQLGAEAQKQYSGDGIRITPTPTGAKLNAAFQRLEGEATSEGLWLHSTAEEDVGKDTSFRVRAMSLSRSAGTPARLCLPSSGQIQTSDLTVIWLRNGLIEEYSTSMDGIRQDFVVPVRPSGEGELTVSLELTGVRAEPATEGAKLIVQTTGRELAYTRLHVTDATGRELAARIEVPSATRMEVRVDDWEAVYPVRIDPTFSDADWVSVGGDPGLNGAVHAIAVDGSGNVYVGGSFTEAGTVLASNIAKWNGSAWSALGTGVSGDVSVLAVSGTNVYAGGSFLEAGGVLVNGIAKWNGSTWSALGSGTNGGGVLALTVSGTDLYAGGYFSMAGDVEANGIAKWNGAAWSALGSGIGGLIAGGVHALAVSGTDLYAGGSFTTAGGVKANNIAKWNGSVWSALGSGVGGLSLFNSVSALAVIGTDLYAGGGFISAGEVNASRIAKWNGTEWSALGSGIGGLSLPSVSALAVVGTDLYAGGRFDTAGELEVNNIAKWNGTEWSALGSGTNNNVHALAVSGTDLYVGGQFTTAGGKVSPYLAKTQNSPRVRITGNGVEIVQGDATPGAGDHTDFGAALVAGGTVTRTFTIHNDGFIALTLGSVSVGGANPADFGVTAQPASPVASDGTATFQVTFNPSAVGVRSATLSFTNNDPAKSPFSFSIQGTGTNSAPTDITLTPAIIAENNPLNAAVGTLAAGDPDPGQAHTFSLVPGAGDTNNSSFTITSSTLRLTLSANYEAKNSYAIRVQANDGNGGTFTKALTVTITDVNEAPTDFALNNATLAENNAPHATVGTFTATDPDPANTHTFALVAGSGGADNAAFTIAGNLLTLNASANFEVKPSYAIRVRATDNGSPALSYEKPFTITIIDANDAPTDIALSNATLAENNAPNAPVGTFSAIDPDLTNTHTFALVAGSGDTDNAEFTITGNQLTINVSADFETKPSYSIRVRATDNGTPALSVEKAFLISITDADDPGVNDAPSNLSLDNSILAENNTPGVVVGNLSVSDPDPEDTHVFALVAGSGAADNPAFTITGNQLTLNAAADFEGKTSYSIRVRATDNGTPALSVEKAFLISVIDGNDPPFDLLLDSDTIAENNPPGALVGDFSVSDQDSADTHIFALVAGEGDEDNGAFLLTGSGLHLVDSADFETKTSYSVRVRATDDGEPPAYIEQVFEITVLDVPGLTIAIWGNGTLIPSGDTEPDESDDTHFGAVDPIGGQVTRTFTIRNESTGGSLQLTGDPLVQITGAHADEFAVTVPPSALIPGGTETTFEITFDPKAQGIRTAQVSVTSEDSSNALYTFAIAGTGTSSDLDGNGFTAFQEFELSELLSTPFQVGATVNLDLGAIVGPLAPGQHFGVTGLPKGLTIDKLTGVISGTILAENGNAPVVLSIQGANPKRSIVLKLTVLPYAFQGGYEVLIENESGTLPVGKSKLTVTGPGTWTATLDLRGQKTRTAKGFISSVPVEVTFPLVPNKNLDLVLPETKLSFAIASTSDSDLVSGSVTSGSFAGATLRGFRLAKPGRAPKVPVTVSLTAAGDRIHTPGGSGYATGTGDGKGLLPLKGALGDAQAFTAGLSVSQTNQAVVFWQPYKDKASSFFGGILDIGDLGLPKRGAPTESSDAGLKWRKYDDPADKELAYPDGFGLDEPLAVTGTVSVWHPASSPEAMALALGLARRELYPTYAAPPAGILPSVLGLRQNFSLVRLGSPASVPWSGSANKSTGTFGGSLTLAAQTAVAGVFLEDVGTDPGLVGTGLMKIPLSGDGLPPRSYETAGIALRNDGASSGPATAAGGFTAGQIAQLNALVATPLQVGAMVNLNLGGIIGLPLPAGQQFEVTGLPKGLTIDKLSGRISGTILAENGTVPGALTIKGANPPRSIPFSFTVLPYRFQSGYEVLIESGSLPVGKSKLTVTGPGTWTATLNLRGQKTRTAKGSFSTLPIVVLFPEVPNKNVALKLPETRLSFTISPFSGAGELELVTGSITTGSFFGSTLRGFRLAKPGRAPKVPVTVALIAATEGNRTDTPGGNGYATGTGDGKGLLPLKGALGDAQGFTAGVNVSQTNQAVVFLQPYKDKEVSFFGGILTVGDLGLPERGAPVAALTSGLKWRKYNDPIDKELAYPDGFGLSAPLAVTATVSVWHPAASAEALALALGLNLRELYPDYVAPPDLPTHQTLPAVLGLRPNFGLVRLGSVTSVPWSGSANKSTGTFTGSLALPTLAPKSPVSGVFLEEAGSPLVGAGLIKIPISGTGIAKGSYQTMGIRLRNAPLP